MFSEVSSALKRQLYERPSPSWLGEPAPETGWEGRGRDSRSHDQSSSYTLPATGSHSGQQALTSWQVVNTGMVVEGSYLLYFSSFQRHSHSQSYCSHPKTQKLWHHQSGFLHHDSHMVIMGWIQYKNYWWYTYPRLSTVLCWALWRIQNDSLPS